MQKLLLFLKFFSKHSHVFFLLFKSITTPNLTNLNVWTINVSKFIYFDCRNTKKFPRNKTGNKINQTLKKKKLKINFKKAIKK
jgi:hypothetical protein